MAFQQFTAITYVLLLPFHSPRTTRLRDRFERLGTLEELTLASSDTCREGLHDVMEHVMAKIFPGIERAPFADVFHKAKIICDSMFPGNPLYAVACR